MLSLIFPTQGNPISVKTTLDSTKGIVDEVVIGSVCVFKDDLDLIKSYQNEYNIKIVELPFDFIFKHGFSHTLNTLISQTSNNLFIYLNTGEIIQSGKEGIKEKINDDYNAYYIDHLQEAHRWWRVGDKRELKWSGLLHEELVGEYRPYYKPLFTFGDTEKDTMCPLKSMIMNDLKESVYWQQLCKVVEDESLQGAMNDGWVFFAKDQYQSMKERLAKKGKRYQALVEGDLEMYINDVMTNPEFEKERYESDYRIEFQGSPMYLGKK